MQLPQDPPRGTSGGTGDVRGDVRMIVLLNGGFYVVNSMSVNAEYDFFQNHTEIPW